MLQLNELRNCKLCDLTNDLRLFVTKLKLVCYLTTFKTSEE